MGAGSRDREAVCGRDLGRRGTQRSQTHNRLVDRFAHRRRQLDDRRVELRLERARQIAPTGAAQEQLDACHGPERPDVEDHQLFLHSERERRALAEVSLDHVLPRMPCTGRPAASHA